MPSLAVAAYVDSEENRPTVTLCPFVGRTRGYCAHITTSSSAWGTARNLGSVSFYVSKRRTLDDFAVSAGYQNLIYIEWVNNIGGDGRTVEVIGGIVNSSEYLPYPGGLCTSRVAVL